MPLDKVDLGTSLTNYTNSFFLLSGNLFARLSGIGAGLELPS